jgi:hypothetical protein
MSAASRAMRVESWTLIVTSAPPPSGFNTRVLPLIDFTVPSFRAG